MTTKRFEVVRDRNFAFYAGGNTISWIGSWMQRTGIGWLSWDLTHSPTWVGAIALAQYLPIIFAAPLFGVLLDRIDRKRYAVLVQAIYLVLGIGLFVLQVTGLLSIWTLFFYCLLLGLCASAYQPARLSLVYDIAPENLLTQAISVNSMLFNLSRLIGPALGGIAIAAYGVGFTFLINAVSHLATLAAFLVITIRPSERRSSSGGVLSQLVEGIRYALAHERIRELLFLSFVLSVFARGMLELLPAFAGGVFNAGSNGLATLLAAGGLGSITAGFAMSQAHDDRKLNRLVRIGVVGIGIAVALFGLTKNYPLGIAIVVAVGMLSTWGSVGMQAILQSRLDSGYRGRVVSLWGMSSVAGPAVGAGLLGALAEWLGLNLVTFLSGVLCTLVCGYTVSKSKYFRTSFIEQEITQKQQLDEQKLEKQKKQA